MQIDLNSDLGEGFGPWRMGEDARILRLVSSANIACGGHAGDAETMFATISLAVRQGVVIGAHPGYCDLAGFGRRDIAMPAPAIARMVAAQIGALQGVAALAGGRVRYVKPHGALANLAARDKAAARAISDAIAAMPGHLAVLAISGTALDLVARQRGLTVFREVFADRAYLSSGQLMPRDQPGAVITSPDIALARMLRFLDSGMMQVADGPPIPLAADSICLHGDSPTALDMAQALHEGLIAAGVRVAPFLDAA